MKCIDEVNPGRKPLTFIDPLSLLRSMAEEEMEKREKYRSHRTSFQTLLWLDETDKKKPYKQLSIKTVLSY